jgi:hypothetical protein
LDACPASAFRTWSREELEILSGRLPSGDRTFAIIPHSEVVVLWATVCDEDASAALDSRIPVAERGVVAFDACGWESFDLVSREEMSAKDVNLGTVWAYYPVLKQLGVPHEVSRPLMRVLILDGRI